MQETQEMWVWSLGQDHHMEKEMATYSSILAWKIPWAEEPDGLQSLGLQRVRLDWQTDHAPVYRLFICISIIWTLCICPLLFDWKLFFPILSWSFDSNIFCFLSCLKLHKIFWIFFKYFFISVLFTVVFTPSELNTTRLIFFLCVIASD